MNSVIIKITLGVLISLSFISAQNSIEKTDPRVITGDWSHAQKASFKPDASHVAVYMLVDQNFKYTTEELIPALQTYFDHYGLPVIFVKQSNPGKKDMCSFRIYVNGKTIQGNLSTGNFSMLRIKYDHENIFARIKTAYNSANL